MVGILVTSSRSASVVGVKARSTPVISPAGFLTVAEVPAGKTIGTLTNFPTFLYWANSSWIFDSASFCGLGSAGVGVESVTGAAAGAIGAAAGAGGVAAGGADGCVGGGAGGVGGAFGSQPVSDTAIPSRLTRM